MRKLFMRLIPLLGLLALAVTPALAQAPAGQAYVVQPGDRLTGLAEQFLGDPNAYPAIVEATNARAVEDDSFAVIGNPDLLQVGQKLWLPVPGFAGAYTAELPAASGPGRLITLSLTAGGTAELSTDYLNSEAPVVETGAWAENDDGTVTVTLTGRADGTVYDAPTVITFALTGETLTAVEYDQSLYGSEGLTLQKETQIAAALLPANVVGIYKSMMIGASSPGLDSTLYLNIDGSARQVDDFLNDEPPIVELGAWNIIENQVVLTKTGQAERLYDTPIVNIYSFEDKVLVEQHEVNLPGAYVTRYLPFDALAQGLRPVPYDAAAAEQQLVESGYGGIYKAFLPAATCCGQDITLTLNPDGPAWLKTNFLNGEPPIVATGVWEAVSDTRLELRLEGADSPLMLERANGVLQTTADEDEYGEIGLTLYEFGTIALNSNLPAVSGTVSYRQRIALPPEALITVLLVDVSLADAPAQVISEQVITAGGQQPPFPFELSYNPRTYDPARTYALQARIESNGELLFTTTSQYRVLTGEGTGPVEVMVEPAGARASAATLTSCAAVPVVASDETPPERASYLPYESAPEIAGSEIVGDSLTVPDDADTTWRDTVLGQLGYCSGGDSSPQRFTLYRPGPDSVITIFLVEIPFDDSVAAEEIRLDLTRQAGQQWQVAWGGVRFLCARGPNTTDLTAELCP